MSSVNIGRRSSRVVLINNDTKKALGFDWEGAIQIGRVIAYKARGVIPAEKERFGPYTVRFHEPTDSVLVEDLGGALLFELPAKVAIEIGGGIIGKGHELESEVKAQDIAYEHAILQRKGVVLGLTDNAAVQQIAGKEAAWNTELRRYIPSSANLLQVSIGTPSVSKGGKDG